MSNLLRSLFYTEISSFTSQSYLSFKRAATTEGKVIGFKRKSEAGQPTDKLGSLILELNGVTFSCGSGLDDRTRAYWWQHRDQLIGKTVEFKYQPSEQVKPRFPVFLRFR